MPSRPAALIFNVQRFSVHDGPGIRSTVFFKGCPLSCTWCQNPESIDAAPELAFYADRCTACHGCVSSCPNHALSGDGRAVDRLRCKACGACVSSCAHGALDLVGRAVTVEELLSEVERDRPFYEATGGGVTLSGGEPTLQPAFLVRFANACRDSGLQVVLQTCGAFRWRTMAPHLGLFQLVQYDLKVMVSRAHRRLAGTGNRAILDNARRLVAASAPVQFRLPVIPGATDGDANVSAVAGFLAELAVGELTLLPYHRLGEVKRSRLGKPVPPGPGGDAAATERSMAQTAELLRTYGIEPLADPWMS